VIVGVIAGVIAAVMFFAFSGGDDSDKKDEPNNAPAAEDPVAMADGAVVDIKKKHNLSTAAGTWEAGKEILARAETWKGENKIYAANALLPHGLRLQEEAIKIDVDFLPYREAKGHRKYSDELEPFTTATYLLETDRILARDLHRKMVSRTKAHGGWTDANEFAELDQMLAILREKEDRQKTREDSPFFAAATAMETKILEDLENRFKDYTDDRWHGATMQIHEPFVFFVQNDKSWDPKREAIGRSRSLRELQSIIIEEFKDLDLKPVQEPVPVLLFRNHGMYLRYSGSPPMVYAHFEPTTGRLAIHDDCDHTTVMHEGTHQLMWFWTKREGDITAIDYTERSYWFQEGIAEWYSGSAMLPKEGGGYVYEIGLLQEGRLGNLGTSMDSRPNHLFNLKELMSARYGHRPKISRQGRDGELYAQGWFFIYFMNHFNVDDEGYVHPKAKGKYADRWREYVKRELTGDTGLDVFMEVMGLDEEGMKTLRDEHWRFALWCRKKVSLKATAGKHIIPWTEQKSRRGELVGEKEDDLLPPFPEGRVPPWDRNSITGDDAPK
jgi:hypothetical protein